MVRGCFTRVTSCVPVGHDDVQPSIGVWLAHSLVRYANGRSVLLLHEPLQPQWCRSCCDMGIITAGCDEGHLHCCDRLQVVQLILHW